MQQLIEAVDAVSDAWNQAEALYREFNNIPPDEQLSNEDWLIVEAVKQQLQQTEGINA